MSSELPDELTLPLAGWADRQLRRLTRLAPRLADAELSGAGLLGERAALSGFAVPGRVSAGGGCRLYACRDGHAALNLARAEDRELLPALFADPTLNPSDDDQIGDRMARCSSQAIVARGREMGLAVAAVDERPANPACTATVRGPAFAAPPWPLLVIDLAGLWAGPLAGHLLRLAGARVVKVESVHRPDAMRDGDPALFARLNGGKDSVLLDLRNRVERQQLVALLRRADIVIESARPRALRQLGIDADALVRETPGLVWVSITGHGVAGGAEWVGFGDDCAVAGGLTAAFFAASGSIGFVGDAIADPLTGIAAARAALAQRRSGRGARLVIAMSGVVASALAWEKRNGAAALHRHLLRWAQARGQPFPKVPTRAMEPVRPLGTDNAAWLGAVAC